MKLRLAGIFPCLRASAALMMPAAAAPRVEVTDVGLERPDGAVALLVRALRERRA